MRLKVPGSDNFFILSAITQAEWRMQVRSRSFWLAILVAVALVLTQALTWERFPSCTPLAQSLDLGSDRSTELLILLLVFVCAPTFFRDESSGVGELLWTTPISATQYISGKFIAVLTLGLSLFLVTETIAWVTVQVGLQIPFYAALPLHLVARLALLLPTLCLALSVNLFLTVLVGRLRLFLLSSCLLWLGWTGFLLPSSLLRPGNFIPVGVFYSAILGLGPDRTLLVANRVLWSGAALVTFALGVALYTWRERRARLPFYALWRPGLLGVAGLGLVIGGWMTLKYAAGSLQADPLPARLLPADSSSFVVANSPLSDWSAVKALTVAADVSLSPGDGRIRGETTLTLQYTGQGTLKKVPLLLNSGLQVTRVLESDQEVTFTRAGLELVLQPQVPLKPGAAWVVKILYEGRYKTPRVAYRDYETCLRKVVEAQSYLGQDVAFLTRDGDWYPWPLSPSSRREAQGHLTVRLSSARQTFHTGQETTDGKLVWNGRWPAALVASYPLGKLQRLVVAGGHAYLADSKDTVAREQAFDYAAAYAGMSHWMEEETSSIILVQVPLVLQPIAGSNSSGQDIVFIPEGTAFVNRQQDGWSGARVKGEAIDRRRARSREAIAAWWSARLDFPSPRYVSACPWSSTDCGTDPGCTLQVLPRSLFLDLLSSVSSGAWLGTTGQAIDRADEALLLNRVLRQNSSFKSQAEMEQAWTLFREAEKELNRRGVLPVFAIPYGMLDIAPDSLDLVEAWVNLGDEALGKMLYDWLDAHRGGQADMYDLLKRLRQ